MKTKQLIIVRKDLNMPAGKMTAHAAIKSYENAIDYAAIKGGLYKKSLEDWVCGSYTKVVLQVKNLDELKIYVDLAIANEIPCAVIKDEGRTVFNGNETITCFGVGPFESDKLTELFGGLRLY